MARIRPLFWISCVLLLGVDLKLAWADPNVALFNQVLSYMDQSLEPCQNFQNYSTKYAKWIKPPTHAKFHTMLAELKDQDFEEGSLEGKIQRFYNICLARTPRPFFMEPVQRLTLQELEIQHGISLSKYLEFNFDQTVPPNATVHVMSQEIFQQFKELLKNFNPDETRNTIQLYGSFQFSLSFPDIERVYECSTLTSTYLELASNLLYEERVLGPAKVSQYQSQVQPIFNAIRHQIITRLNRNSVNWTTTEIKDLQDNLKSLTLRIGHLPKKHNHRQFVTNRYKHLNFTIEDDYDSAVLKARQVLGLEEERELFSGFSKIHRSGNIIAVPYNLLENLAFDLESHDLFKMTQLGIQLVIAMVDIDKGKSCTQKNIDFLKMLDGFQFNVPMYHQCTNRSNSDNLLAIQQIVLIALNIVHESYFAPKSKFTQIQPSFTTTTLKQLSFLRLAQSYYIELTGLPLDGMLNQLTKLPSFVQAFNCPNLR
uniref:Uncharacterized protein LOC108046800 n=1 Tax=Drosophila rhopaloa TaxID=1041015 RepID=A0A6P4F491_DRORH